MLPRYLIVIVTILLYPATGCKTSVLPLSEAEMDFVNTLSQKYECDAAMLHDIEAIRDNKTDGSLWIQLEHTTESGICSKDSFLLKKIAKDIAIEAGKIISYKQHYNSIAIDFAIGIGTNTWGKTLCDKEVKMNFPGLNNIVMTSYFVYTPPPVRDEPY